MDLDSWAREAYQLFESGISGASEVGVVFPPTPDGISSAVIIAEILSQKGLESNFIVSTPENSLDAIESCIGKCDSMIFLDLPPHGKGPLQVSTELYRNTMIIDHGSLSFPNYNYGRGIIRINADMGGITTGLLAYFIALQVSEDNDILSWVAASGFYGECTSNLCIDLERKTLLSWPELMEGNSLGRIRRVLVSSSYLGEEWVLLAVSALQESFDDPSWFLNGNSATASIIRSRVEEVQSEIRDILDEPYLRRRNFGAWESPEPYQRFILSMLAREEIVENALSFFYDPPLGLVYLVGDPRKDIYERVSSYLENFECSIFGGKGFLSIIVDSEFLRDLVYSLSRSINEEL